MKLLFSSWFEEVVDNRGKPVGSWDEVSLKLPESFDKERPMSGFIGWAGVIIMSDNYDIVEMAYKYATSLQSSSCAKCFPCRVGTRVLEDVLFKILDGEGAEEDLYQILSLCDSIAQNSKCGIGQLGAKPIADTVKHFKDDYLDYINGGRKRSNFQYPYKVTAPCTSACPTGMDIPQYIEDIKEEKFGDSLANIREASVGANMLGRACFHPCESNCRRDNVDSPLQICKLKRFAWDYEDQHSVEKPSNPNMHTREEKVAIIGAGICGLSAGYLLSLKGFRVTIFEKLPNGGGAARTGIPQYRVPNEMLDKEYQYVADMGADFQYGVHFGTDETFKSLRDKGYKAIFLATGADLTKSMRVEGENEGYEGVYGGIDILKDIKQKTNPVPHREHVLVIGGGNTAMDCCRSYARLGSKVTVVYRRTAKELPCDPHEYAEALDEGVEFMFLEAPTKIIAKDGKVSGLESQVMVLGEPDDSGRRRPVAVEGSEHIIDCDCIISAIGQDCDISYLKEEPAIGVTKWDNPVADDDTLQCAAPDVFAGGDCMLGPLTLVDAAGQGRRAAQSIEQYLLGEEVRISDEQVMEKIIRRLGAYDKNEIIAQPSGWKRQVTPICDRDSKLNSFNEVELGLTQEQAMEEAARCMRCYIVGMASVPVKNGGAK